MSYQKLLERNARIIKQMNSLKRFHKAQQNRTNQMNAAYEAVEKNWQELINAFVAKNFVAVRVYMARHKTLLRKYKKTIKI